jgi:hypothetical protein
MAVPMPSVGVAGRTPALWSVGLLGFLARGGFLLILLPMLALPSPVSLSVLIGPDLVDANGLSARVAALLLLAGGLVVLAVAGGLVMAALTDIAAFDGVLSAAGVAVPSSPAGRPAARLVAELLALQLVAALPLLLALVPTVAAMAGVVRQEILLPSDQGLPLWWRVVEGTWPWLALVGATALLATHIYSVVGRELLARHAGLLPPASSSSTVGRVLGAAAALFRRPLRAMAASVVVWAMGIVGAILAAALIALGWTIAQVVYLSPPAGATLLATVATLLAAAAGTAMLVGLLGVALILLGATAAMRSALLTRAALGGRRLA